MNAQENHKSFVLEIKVIPNAPKSKIEGWEEGRLKVKIRALPEKGKANAELIALLANVFDLPKSQIELLTGATSRLKRVRIHGLSQEEGLLRFNAFFSTHSQLP